MFPNTAEALEALKKFLAREIFNNLMVRGLSQAEKLCHWAAFPAGYAAARPLSSRIGQEPWWASLGWFALAVLIWAGAVTVWAAILSLVYEYSPVPEQRKRLVVFLLGPAVPASALTIGWLKEAAWTKAPLILGLGVGMSLGWGFLAWAAWRFLLFIERWRAKEKG